MTQVIETPEFPYVVQIGEKVMTYRNVVTGEFDTDLWWSFDSAFRSLERALNEYERKSQDNEFVRLILREKKEETSG